MAYQASQWLKIHALLTPEELLALGAACAPFELFPLGRVVMETDLPGSIENFGELYRSALEGKASPHALACAWTVESEAIRVKSLANNGRALIEILSPVLQIRAHFVRQSEADGSIRSMAWGPDALFWGMEFSYPQIYQQARDCEIVSALQLPNAQLFRKLRQWIRDETEPTAFSVEGKKVVSPVRMGRTVVVPTAHEKYLWR